MVCTTNPSPFFRGLLFAYGLSILTGRSVLWTNQRFSALKKLDEERAKMFQQARKEAFENAKAAIAELNAFGHNYTLAPSFADWILST